jgi:hypothetical protein
MFFIIIFIISGALIVLLLLGKRFEERTHRRFFLLSLVSLGDTQARELSHKSLEWYGEAKEKFNFFVKKQFPMQIKGSFMKFESRMEEKFGQFTTQLRDSKLLKKNDGISDFLKSIAEVEKGNGSIDESFTDSQNSSDTLE